MSVLRTRFFAPAEDYNLACYVLCAVTAGGKGYLRTLSLAKLKNYMQSYGMRLGPDVLEKEDVIDAIINARVSPVIHASQQSP